jgi:hypothetical protein
MGPSYVALQGNFFGSAKKAKKTLESEEARRPIWPEKLRKPQKSEKNCEKTLETEETR